MSASQKCQYSLRALFELAKRCDDGPVRVADIAEAQSIPPRFLELILQELRRFGMVESRRGNNGGYLLALPPAAVSVGDIVRSMDGSLSPVRCVDGGDKEHCRQKGRCAFSGLWQKAQQAVQQIYDNTSLQDLLDVGSASAERHGLLKEIDGSFS